MKIGLLLFAISQEMDRETETEAEKQSDTTEVDKVTMGHSVSEADRHCTSHHGLD